MKVKLQKLGIYDFVENLFSAEEVGFMKPQQEYYNGLFKKIEISKKEDILFIGDDLEKDIKGGLENGLDTCWCNYNNTVNNKYNTKYEIHKLDELTIIL